MATSALELGSTCGIAQHSDGSYWTIRGGPKAGTVDQSLLVKSTDGLNWVVQATVSATERPHALGYCLIVGDVFYFHIGQRLSGITSYMLGRYNILTTTLTIDDTSTPTLSNGGLVANVAGTHVYLGVKAEYRSMGSGYLRSGYCISANGGAFSSPTTYADIGALSYGNGTYFDGNDAVFHRDSDGSSFKIILSTGVVSSSVTVPSHSGTPSLSDGFYSGGAWYFCSNYSSYKVYKSTFTSTTVTTVLEHTFSTAASFISGSSVFPYYDSVNGILHYVGVYDSSNECRISHNAWNGVIESGWTVITRNISNGSGNGAGSHGAIIDLATLTDTNIDVVASASYAAEPSFNYYEHYSIHFVQSFNFALGSSIDIDGALILPALSQIGSLITAPPARNISGDLILPPLTILSDIESFRVDRDLSGVFILPSLTMLSTLGLTQFARSHLLQLNHKLTGFLFASDDVRYILRVNNSLVVSMINFTISSFSELDGVSSLSSRITAPVGYYEELSELVGLQVAIYMQVGLTERLLASTILEDISTPENKKTITLYSSSSNYTASTGAFSGNNKQFYERNISNQKAIRIAPNYNIRHGDVVEYGEHKAQITANKVTTFIGQDQQFTEVSN